MATTPDTNVGSTSLSSGDWKVDPSQSKLEFRTRAMGLFPVKGSYSGFSGALHVDPSGVAKGDLHIEAATVATGIKKRDEHLRSKDFFHTDAYPHMKFDLTGIEPASDGTARLTGTLRIRDRDLPIDTPVTLAATGTHGLLLEATFEVDHRAAGFEFKRLPRRVQIETSITLQPAD
jgi:polyisoprenoid-binding protein YceI